MPVVRTGGVTGGGTGTGASMDLARFQKLLEEQGRCVLWEKAIVCPFRAGPSPRDHDINCTVCRAGFLYYDPQECRMVMQSFNISESYYAYGRFDTGKQTVTALPGVKLSFWDRITVCDSRIRFTELIYRQPEGVRDLLKYVPLEVDMVIWVNRSRAQVTYTQDTEFTIDADTGEIVWGATRPDDGSFYVIAYYHRPRYLIIDLPHVVRDLKERQSDDTRPVKEFPVQAVAQLDFIERDESKDPVDEDLRQNSPFPDRQ